MASGTTGGAAAGAGVVGGAGAAGGAGVAAGSGGSAAVRHATTASKVAATYGGMNAPHFIRFGPGRESRSLAARNASESSSAPAPLGAPPLLPLPPRPPAL